MGELNWPSLWPFLPKLRINLDWSPELSRCFRLTLLDPTEPESCKVHARLGKQKRRQSFSWTSPQPKTQNLSCSFHHCGDDGESSCKLSEDDFSVVSQENVDIFELDTNKCYSLLD